MFSFDVISMEWRDLLFAHWRVPEDIVDPKLPDALETDTYDGDAWLGVVPFVMERIRPRFVPEPLGLSFGELNLRTYVEHDGDPGIYFFNLDADDPVGVEVARRLYDLPYYRARMRVERDDSSVDFTSSRTHPGAPSANFRARYGPDGGSFVADEGSLAEWLTERYRFYTAGVDASSDAVFYGDVKHPRWRLHDAWAEFETNDLFEANGFDEPGGEPVLHYSQGTDVRASMLRKLG